MNRFELRIFAVFITLLVLSGCTHEESITSASNQTQAFESPLELVIEKEYASATSSVDTSVILPTVHAWSYLREYGDEPENYATYSYILVGRTYQESETVRNFYSLIQAVQGSTSSTGEIFADIPSWVINIFLIPADKNQNLPDTNLAKSYVSALEASHEKFQRPGPFIVTLLEPISSPSNMKDMLIVDLTDVHEGAFKEVVGVFKDQVMSDQISGTEVLQSFKISLLNMAFIIEDSIHFASTAYGQMKAIFHPE